MTALTPVIGLLACATTALSQEKRVAFIDFFGHEGVDAAAIVAALPFKEGDRFPANAREAVSGAVLATTGKAATDVAAVCCTETGDWLIYVGIAGGSSRPIDYKASPTGILALPQELVRQDEAMSKAWIAAMQRGVTGEDRSAGYALSKDTAVRAKQLELRRLALLHERVIYKVLEGSADPLDRATAAFALGYAGQTKRQIAALVRAASDPDSTVRNNAVRALAVLVEAKPSRRRKVPARVFVDTVCSGTWTDRNKGAWVLERLTATRDPALMSELQAKAVPCLVETAKWRWSGHNSNARLLLGRIVGIEERRLQQMVNQGDPIWDKVKPAR